MSKDSAIQWTDHTWNPWYGCHKVSEGCKNCYMFREQKRYGRDPSVVTRSKTMFKAPLKWKEPARVFTCSWSDWFIEEADAWRDEAWEIIEKTPHLTYQILTKRPERIADHMPKAFPNVHLGVSVENQKQADERMWDLLTAPEVIKFVSCEPLLEPISFDTSDLNHVNWLIAGGESGPGARPMEAKWARSLRDQCRSTDTAFFMKQMGGISDKKGALEDIPEDLRIREFPDE